MDLIYFIWCTPSVICSQNNINRPYHVGVVGNFKWASTCQNLAHNNYSINISYIAQALLISPLWLWKCFTVSLTIFYLLPLISCSELLLHTGCILCISSIFAVIFILFFPLNCGNISKALLRPVSKESTVKNYKFHLRTPSCSLILLLQILVSILRNIN